MHTHNCVTLLGWAVSQVTPCHVGLLPHGSLVAVPPEGWHVSHPTLFVHPAGPPAALYRSHRAVTSAAAVGWADAPGPSSSSSSSSGSGSSGVGAGGRMGESARRPHAFELAGNGGSPARLLPEPAEPAGGWQSTVACTVRLWPLTCCCTSTHSRPAAKQPHDSRPRWAGEDASNPRATPILLHPVPGDTVRR
jgi:hypothetical protein